MYIIKLIRNKLISKSHDELLADYFDIEKSRKLIAQKSDWETLRHNIEIYIIKYNICQASKAINGKNYTKNCSPC